MSRPSDWSSSAPCDYAQITIKPDADRVVLEARQWQNLVDLQARLATYLRSAGQPPEDD